MDTEHPLKGFPGFQAPQYTPIPDQLFDIVMNHLTAGELRTLLYIMRHTFGYKKDGDRLSAMQLAEGIRRRDGSYADHGTGLTVRQVRKVIAQLEELGLIVVSRAIGENGSQINYYTVRMADVEEAIGGELQDTPGVNSRTPPPVNSRTPQGVNPGTPTRTDVQETTQETTLSLLTDEYFRAIGETAPHGKRRERARQVIADLTAGYDKDIVREAFAVYVERQGYSPDFLYQVVGIAAGRVAERAKQIRRMQQDEANRDAQLATERERTHADLVAVQKLPTEARERLYSIARNRFVGKIEGPLYDKVFPPFVASIWRDRTPELESRVLEGDNGKTRPEEPPKRKVGRR